MKLCTFAIYMVRHVGKGWYRLAAIHGLLLRAEAVAWRLCGKGGFPPAWRGVGRRGWYRCPVKGRSDGCAGFIRHGKVCRGRNVGVA